MPDELGPSPGLYNNGSATMPLANWDREHEKGMDKRVRKTTEKKVPLLLLSSNQYRYAVQTFYNTTN